MTSAADKPSDGSVQGPEDISPRGWKRILVDTWKDAGEDNLSLVAAGVAFYAFLAFVPLLTAFVLSYGLFAEPASVVSHMQTLTSVMPSQSAGLIGDQLESMTETSGAQHGFAMIVALGIALYGASKGAGSIMTALNIVFGVEESRGFIKRTVMALAMTTGAVIVLFLAILAISALHFLESLAPDFGGVAQFIIKAAFFLMAGGAVVLLLAAIYRYGPNRPEQAWKWITPGSGAATLVWLAATAGFGLYVSNFGNYNATYGSLGAVIVFLTWLYLTAYVVLMGAELNALLETEAAREEHPKRNPSADADQSCAAAKSKTVSPPVKGPAASPSSAPSPAKLAARIGMFAIVLAVLGKARRPTLVP